MYAGHLFVLLCVRSWGSGSIHPWRFGFVLVKLFHARFQCFCSQLMFGQHRVDVHWCEVFTCRGKNTNKMLEGWFHCIVKHLSCCSPGMWEPSCPGLRSTRVVWPGWIAAFKDWVPTPLFYTDERWLWIRSAADPSSSPAWGTAQICSYCFYEVFCFFWGAGGGL